ncbi:MAG: glycosyltransferase family 4 protein [Bacteroidales bacterium]|nr:glycosyltransferase family 4 protein [Bacteroidales bacterium]
MKIVHINKTDAGGGAAVAALRIHRSLLRSGIDSHILVQEQRRNEANEHTLGKGMVYDSKNFYRFVKERLTILPQERDSNMRYNFSIANTGQSIVDAKVVQEADIIHLHWINQGFLSLENLKEIFELGKPIVWTLHDMWPFTGGCHYAGTCFEFNEHCGFCPFLKKKEKRDMSFETYAKKREIYANGNLTVVTCSRWLASMAKSSSLLKNTRVTTIPNPIDTKFYRPMDREVCREELGLPQDKKLILFGAANILDVRKGFRYLEEALTIIQDNFPAISDRIELVVFGKLEKGWTNRFSFKIHTMDFISDPMKLVKLYNAADTFILPSLQDNLPNTVVESLCCGTPVVGFGIGGIPEMITHMQTGFLAEVKNSLSLANGIYNMLFFNQQQRDQVREAAIATFAENIVSKQYIDLYNKLLNQ